MKKFFKWLIIILFPIYVIICAFFYLFQRNIIFRPDKLNKDYQFRFHQDFEEMYIKTTDGVSLHGLLFKSSNPKGVIFYLHGNAGALDSWGYYAPFYTVFGYDMFMLDYRGFGKSEGVIGNEDQLHEDIQTAYNEIKKRYDESQIVVVGYSVGTGLAAKLASSTSPKELILQAPYYNLTDLVQHIFPVMPSFAVKYKLETNRYIEDCKMPVTIFHGEGDEVIPYIFSEKLKEHFKSTDTLIKLENQKHNGMNENAEYRAKVKEILNR